MRSVFARKHLFLSFMTILHASIGEIPNLMYSTIKMTHALYISSPLPVDAAHELLRQRKGPLPGIGLSPTLPCIFHAIPEVVRDTEICRLYQAQPFPIVS